MPHACHSTRTLVGSPKTETPCLSPHFSMFYTLSTRPRCQSHTYALPRDRRSGDTWVLHTSVRTYSFPCYLHFPLPSKTKQKEAETDEVVTGGRGAADRPCLAEPELAGNRREGREGGRPRRQPPARLGRGVGRASGRGGVAGGGPVGAAARSSFPRRPRQARAASGAAGAAPANRARPAGIGRGDPASALTMVRPQVGRTTLWLRCGSGFSPGKRSSGRSGPAAPDSRFASGQDGGPKPRLQPETAWVKGRGAGPTGNSWVPGCLILP